MAACAEKIADRKTDDDGGFCQKNRALRFFSHLSNIQALLNQWRLNQGSCRLVPLLAWEPARGNKIFWGDRGLELWP